MRSWIITLLTLATVVGSGTGAYFYLANDRDPTTYRTLATERGPFLAAITATGTLMAKEVIDVGAQVGGSIKRFGVDPRTIAEREATMTADVLLACMLPASPLWSGMVQDRTIDYTSPIEKDTILAHLDDSLYQTEVDRTRAELGLFRAEQSQMEARLKKAGEDLVRAQSLYQSKAIAQEEFDLKRVSHELAQLELVRALHNVKKAETELRKAEINLNYTTIRSPAKGVIIDRRVSVGQTVNASQNAPSLFLIATDLTKLHVWASVNEADIAQIYNNQEVRFSVDAYPNEDFVGSVAEDQPRLNATMTSNVVTYTVVVNIDNSHGKLKPYMTASLRFVQTMKTEALLVPNSALRWRPTIEQVASEHRHLYPKIYKTRRTNSLDRAVRERESSERWVWLPTNGHVRPVRLRIGLNDGTMTEVLEGEIGDAEMVVVGEDVRGEKVTSSGSKKREP